MLITLKAKPNARKNEIIKVSESNYEVKTTATPADGKANEAIVELLAKYFRVAKSRVMIVKGKASHVKIVKIVEEV